MRKRARECERSVLGWTGSDRLSRGLSRSTIGAGGFNGRVRNGIGWNSSAMTTRSAKDGKKQTTPFEDELICCVPEFVSRHGIGAGVQAFRAIRTSKLNASL